MTEIRTAVIGTGYLGRFHAEKYAAIPGSRLVAVVDADAARAAEIGGKLGVDWAADYRELEGRVDAVSVAVPTPLHYEIGEFFLSRGVHVLVEKPMTRTVAEADGLIRAAAEHGCVLQVGHLERFNPAVMSVRDRVREPLFIEAHRISPFQVRGTDVNVVLDLMIHDIDLILSLVDAPITRVDTVGVPVLTSGVDIANARLQFANGCVANVTASRVSNKTERKMRIFESDTYVSIDFQQKAVEIRQRRDGTIDTETLSHQDADALRAQIESFLAAIRGNIAPVVSGADGRRALETALAISEQLQAQMRRTVSA
ncbi:MAG: Gfo/Idh/MocA family oxidoreductase [Gammaproteobacteria bacterium]|nr:Gfo/Idh/MocA family oxidoreductase [Gammaproteobacteria bacterium]